jgi:hypothetical protein
MSFSDALEDAALDHIFGGPDYTRVATLYIGLSTSDPGEAAAGLAEPSGGSYARVALVNSSNNWDAAASGVKRNTGAITFPEATGSWGNVNYVAIWDNPTSTGAGAFLGSGALGTAKNVVTGDTPRFQANSLSITLD